MPSPPGFIPNPEWGLGMATDAVENNGRLALLDFYLCDFRPFRQLTGFARFAVEFVYFGMKEARACLFAGLLVSTQN
jgi:hypothetical protein